MGLPDFYTTQLKFRQVIEVFGSVTMTPGWRDTILKIDNPGIMISCSIKIFETAPGALLDADILQLTLDGIVSGGNTIYEFSISPPLLNRAIIGVEYKNEGTMIILNIRPDVVWNDYLELYYIRNPAGINNLFANISIKYGLV